MPDPRWGVLLDLDETLVRTIAIEPLRAQRAWGQVMRSLSRTALPPGTHRFLRDAGHYGHLGVVTMSPRMYAEGLLAHHGLGHVPVLVAWHDVQHRKPHPEPILKAADALGVSPDQCLYVGDKPDDMEAARRAGAVPVGMTWPDLQASSPMLRSYRNCSSWDDVLAVIREVVS